MLGRTSDAVLLRALTCGFVHRVSAVFLRDGSRALFTTQPVFLAAILHGIERRSQRMAATAKIPCIRL